MTEFIQCDPRAGVLSYLQNPLCHMSTILGASWMGGESSPGAKLIL